MTVKLFNYFLIAKHVAQPSVTSLGGGEAQDEEQQRVCDGLIWLTSPPTGPFFDDILYSIFTPSDDDDVRKLNTGVIQP